MIGYVQLHNNIHDYIVNMHHEGDNFYKCSEYPPKKAEDIVPPPSEPSPKEYETTEIEHDTEVHLYEATNEDQTTVSDLREKILSDVRLYFILKDATTINSSLIKLQIRAELLLYLDLNCGEITREVSVLSSETNIGSKRKIQMEDTIISSQKQKVTVSIPVTHDLKFKLDL